MTDTRDALLREAEALLRYLESEGPDHIGQSAARVLERWGEIAAQPERVVLPKRLLEAWQVIGRGMQMAEEAATDVANGAR